MDVVAGRQKPLTDHENSGWSGLTPISSLTESIPYDEFGKILYVRQITDIRLRDSGSFLQYLDRRTSIASVLGARYV
jgi:hypothetical protein